MAAPAFTVVQLSDLHVDPADADDVALMQATFARIDQLKPDLVVVSGDISNDGFHDPAMFRAIRAVLQRWAVPLHIIPGNHDIGDRMADAVRKPQYLAQWLDVFGTDRFSEQRGRWRLLGLNSEIMGTGIAREAEQMAWLDAELDAAAAAAQLVAVFEHSPPYVLDPAEQYTDQSAYWAIEPVARQQLLKRLHRPHVRLVANGHLHWHCASRLGHAAWICCPSAKFVVDDAKFPPGGSVVGVMEHRFEADGVTSRLVPFDVPDNTYYFGHPRVALPGRDEPVVLAYLLIDATGPLGRQLDDRAVVKRLHELAQVVRVFVLTPQGQAATNGVDNVTSLAVRQPGDARAQLQALGPQRVMLISHDRDLLRHAALPVAVGTARSAAPDLLHALALADQPDRLAAAVTTAVTGV